LRFNKWKKPRIVEGELTRWNWMVQHVNHLKLGTMVDIGAFTYINAKYGVTIGDHVQIGSHCSIYSLSTIDDKHGRVILGDNCKVGSHTVIMPGVRIGKNAIVGASSFVNMNIPDNTIAFGVPARITKKIRATKG
jgi:acetyltransferase-like isoleucine patch superfamily enzyme